MPRRAVPALMRPHWELEKKNVRFASDTDTEVVAHLVTEEMKI